MSRTGTMLCVCVFVHYDIITVSKVREAFHSGTGHALIFGPTQLNMFRIVLIWLRYSCTDGASRRKNATRETTSTLKAWLQEHQKNPYPTKGEKIMLAIITRMTLTQAGFSKRLHS